MTDTRYSAEELRKAADWLLPHGVGVSEAIDRQTTITAMLRQAARDAETLAGIRAWLEGGVQAGCSCEWCSLRRRTLDELDRLSRGDA